MKKIITIILVAISLTTFAQDNNFSFDVEITNFRTNNGKVLIQIFDKDRKVIKAIEKNIAEKKCSFKVEGLEKEQYAIRYYHDEDNNKKLGTNWIGIPNEGYGYSNNAVGKYGEPDFKDWLFLLDENKSLILKCYYFTIG